MSTEAASAAATVPAQGTGSMSQSGTGGSMVRTQMAGSTFSIPASHAEKPEKFNGLHFKRWQQKMLFYLTTLGLATYLTNDAPKVTLDGPSQEENCEKLTALDAWNHADFLCRNYVLNGLSDALYNVYGSMKTAKELWESLDKKYKTEDAGAKKFIVGRFLDFAMVDSKSVITQVQELQVICHEIDSEGMKLPEAFKVAVVIEKLPPAWKDFKNYLKHKRKEMNLEELIVRLRIEEDNRASAKESGYVANSPRPDARANLVEHGKNKKKASSSGFKTRPTGGVEKKKFNGKCFNCGTVGHRSADCRKPKKKSQANMVEAVAKDVADLNLCAVVSEVNLVDSHPKEWFIDTGATRHVCFNKDMFSQLDETTTQRFKSTTSLVTVSTMLA